MQEYYLTSIRGTTGIINHIVFRFASLGSGVQVSRQELISPYKEKLPINYFQIILRKLQEIGLLEFHDRGCNGGGPRLYYSLSPAVTDMEALKRAVSKHLPEKEGINSGEHVSFFYGNFYSVLNSLPLTLLLSKILSLGRRHIVGNDILRLIPMIKFSMRRYMSELVSLGFITAKEKLGVSTVYIISDKVFSELEKERLTDFPEIIDTDISYLQSSALNMVNYLITKYPRDYYQTKFFEEKIKISRNTLDSVINKACELNILNRLPRLVGGCWVYTVPGRSSDLAQSLKIYSSSFKKLPIYESLVEKTGSHELAIILNQIIYSRRERLTMQQIRQLCSYTKTSAVLRSKLGQLCSLGLLVKSKGNRPGLFYRNYYSVAADVAVEDKKLAALVEEPDIEENPDYLLAAIINKFRQYVLAGRGDLTISASYFKNLLHSEKTISSIRLKLKALEERGYIDVIGRGSDNALKYRLNVDRLIEYSDKAVLEAKTVFLLDLFKKYLVSENKPFEEVASRKWKISFKRMLNEGYDYKTLKYCIAYMSQARQEYYDVISPAQVRFYYSEVKTKLEGFSKNKLSKRVYDLLNGNVTVNRDKEAVKPMRGALPSQVDSVPVIIHKNL